MLIIPKNFRIFVGEFGSNTYLLRQVQSERSPRVEGRGCIQLQDIIISHIHYATETPKKHDCSIALCRADLDCLHEA